MAQKINPISFRLGITKIWESFLQVYGKSFNSYFIFLHKYFQLQKVLPRIFYKSNFILNYQEWEIHKDKIFLNIYYSYLPHTVNMNKTNCFFKTPVIVSQLLKLKTFIRFYLKSELKSTTNLITAYTKYLLNQNNVPKKALLNICKLLEKNLNSKKISILKSGILITNLKGFKIKLSGRLEGSKNQMAKSIEQSVGSLPLTSIKSYVEYKSEEIYTKSGVCGLQIWLFYEIN